MGASVSRWVPGVQTWIMSTFVSPSSFYIPKTTSWVFSDAAFLGIEHFKAPHIPSLGAGALAVLAGTLMLGTSWALGRGRNATNR